MQNVWLTKDSKNSLVSVIIPTYNRAELLKEAVLSIFKQSYRPIECIVVDDGSTDDTYYIICDLKKLESDNFTLIYIKQNKLGAQVARNTGTRASTGEFLQYLDSDDILYPDIFKNQVTFLEENIECDGVFGDYFIGTLDDSLKKSGYESSNLIKQIVTLSGCIPTFSILFRREIVRKIGDWDIALKKCQEIDFQLRGLLIGAIYKYNSYPTGLWRKHDGPRTMSNLVPEDLVIFYQKVELLLSSNNIFDDSIKNSIANWYVYFSSILKTDESKNITLFICEAVRLNPNIPFYNTRKMKLLRLLTGKYNAIKIWVFFFKLNA
jgi:glycosyltransferase involved in cell wall biosynthesis